MIEYFMEKVAMEKVAANLGKAKYLFQGRGGIPASTANRSARMGNEALMRLKGA